MPSQARTIFVTSLLEWWEENKEWFAFRETSDPYRVLVTEMLLRKTRRKQVDIIYGDFFGKFPSPSAVAKSSPRQIRKIITPLGLYSRALDIFKACEIISRTHGGQVPSNEEELIALPGVGDYVAGVVLTIGFGKPRPMIDSNAKRVFSRISGVSANSNGVFEWVRKEYVLLTPSQKEKEFHFAIMDLAHQICRSITPFCSKCPLRSLCAYSRDRSPEN